MSNELTNDARRRSRALSLGASPRFVVLLCLLATGSIPSSYELKNLATYSTRPLRDKTDFPANLIPHYSAEGLVARSPPSSLSAAAKQTTEKLCKLHRWKTRRPLAQVEVWDAVLFVRVRRHSRSCSVS